ncbi:MAG: TolC family protein, partial [Pseudomonadota bacterium]
AAWERRAAARAMVPEPRVGPAVAGDPQDLSLGLAVAIPLPLLAPGGAALREARATEHAAQDRLAAISRQAAWEIDEILARSATLEVALLAVTVQSREPTRQAAALARERYAAGQLDVLHLVTLQRDWARLEAEHLDLLLESRRALLDLERAVGRPVRTGPTGPADAEVMP